MNSLHSFQNPDYYNVEVTLYVADYSDKTLRELRMWLSQQIAGDHLPLKTGCSDNLCWPESVCQLMQTQWF
jgi:hypothetical protein